MGILIFGGRLMKVTKLRCFGFTLIELLVVIAIISILAAILFPVFARARENARRASCMSNLKQMGLAMMQYTQDYDEAYPFAWSNLGTTPPGGTWNLGTNVWAWAQILYPYHKSLQVFTCPSGVGANDKIPFRGHYGANVKLLVLSGSSAVKLAAVQAPANTYAFMDAGNYTMNPSYLYSLTANNGYYIPGAGKLGGSCAPGTTGAALVDDCNSGRHLDGMNMAFADGHVKWLKSSVVLKEGKTASPPNGAWNPDNG